MNPAPQTTASKEAESLKLKGENSKVAPANELKDSKPSIGNVEPQQAHMSKEPPTGKENQDGLHPAIKAEEGDGHPEPTADVQHLLDKPAEDNRQVANNNEQLLSAYLKKSKVALAFQVIFAEVLHKRVPQDKALAYTAQRLKQIGADMQDLKSR